MRIAPDIVALATAGLIWIVPRFGGDVAVPAPARTIASVLLGAAGIGLVVAARARLAKRGTTWLPLTAHAPMALVADGVYRVSRNPMYLGTWCLLAAEAAWLGNMLAVATSFVFVAFIDRSQIPREEAILRAAFGAEYERYRRSVRRWI